MINHARPPSVQQAEKMHEIGQFGRLSPCKQGLVMRGRCVAFGLLQRDQAVSYPDRSFKSLLRSHDRRSASLEIRRQILAAGLGKTTPEC